MVNNRRYHAGGVKGSIGFLSIALSVIKWAILLIATTVCLVPLYWMVSSAFKLETATWQVPPQFIPQPATLENFKQLFSNGAMRWLLNSVIVSLGTTILSLIFSAMSGYAFATKRFRGRKALFLAVILTMILPSQIILIPLFLEIVSMHLYNSYWGLILPFVAYPFGIFLVRQFAVSLPGELFEAAKLDGANEYQIFVKVALPLLKPAIAALVIFSFTTTWNEFLWQTVAINSNSLQTLPVGVAIMSQQAGVTNYGLVMAGATFAALPLISIFLAFQKYFTKGLTMGSIK